MEALLVPETSATREKATETKIQHWLKHLGIKFFNVTCTDDALASCLLRELGRRGIDPRLTWLLYQIGTHFMAARCRLPSSMNWSGCIN